MFDIYTLWFKCIFYVIFDLFIFDIKNTGKEFIKMEFQFYIDTKKSINNLFFSFLCIAR